MVQVVLLWFAKDNGPDLFAGVLWRAGDELLNGVWHLEVVQLPRGANIDIKTKNKIRAYIFMPNSSLFLHNTPHNNL